ncbi:MAG: hypothetical protein AAFV93_13620 [Chloroflexota bacterium]
MQKSWMWQNQSSAGVSGATIDIEDNRIMWFDQPGCACGDDSMSQTLTDFCENGSRFLVPPADVVAEMHAFIAENLIEA